MASVGPRYVEIVKPTALLAEPTDLDPNGLASFHRIEQDVTFDRLRAAIQQVGWLPGVGPRPVTWDVAPPAGLEPATLRRAPAGPQESAAVHLPGKTVRLGPSVYTPVHGV